MNSRYQGLDIAKAAYHAWLTRGTITYRVGATVARVCLPDNHGEYVIVEGENYVRRWAVRKTWS